MRQIDQFADQAFEAIVMPEDESTGVGAVDQQLSDQMTFPPSKPVSIPAIGEYDGAALAVEIDDLKNEVASLRAALDEAERGAAEADPGGRNC